MLQGRARENIKNIQTEKFWAQQVKWSVKDPISQIYSNGEGSAFEIGEVFRRGEGGSWRKLRKYIKKRGKKSYRRFKGKSQKMVSTTMIDVVERTYEVKKQSRMNKNDTGQIRMFS